MLVEVTPEDPRTPDVRALLETHLRFAWDVTPACGVHALDVDGLLGDDVTLVGARVEGRLLGIGALRRIDAGHGELKSMHTLAEARGQGVGRRVVDHLLDLARAQGFERVSLETGTMDAFAPSRALYASAGFVACPPFGRYVDSPTSYCMTIEL